MKLITAIIRPDKLYELVQVLIASRVPGLTVTEIRGFGRQYGRLAGQCAEPSRQQGGEPGGP